MEIRDIGDLEHLMAGGFIDDDEYDAIAKELGIDTGVDDFASDVDLSDIDDWDVPI